MQICFSSETVLTSSSEENQRDFLITALNPLLSLWSYIPTAIPNPLLISSLLHLSHCLDLTKKPRTIGFNFLSLLPSLSRSLNKRRGNRDNDFLYLLHTMLSDIMLNNRFDVLKHALERLLISTVCKKHCVKYKLLNIFLPTCFLTMLESGSDSGSLQRKERGVVCVCVCV